MKIENNEAIANEGMYIRRKISTDILPYRRCTLIEGESEKDFDEFTEAEYQELVKQQEEQFKLEENGIN